MTNTTLPTKKQRQLLTFIDEFIAEKGFSPSYREIMDGCNYTSVATVALHVRSLIARGHLRKEGRKARTIEVVKTNDQPAKIQTTEVKPSEEKWLVEKVDYKFRQCEESEAIEQATLDGLYVLVGSLKVLGLDGAANSFVPRLSALKKRTR